MGSGSRVQCCYHVVHDRRCDRSTIHPIAAGRRAPQGDSSCSWTATAAAAMGRCTDTVRKWPVMRCEWPAP
jgi:hypothetical protein